MKKLIRYFARISGVENQIIKETRKDLGNHLFSDSYWFANEPHRINVSNALIIYALNLKNNIVPDADRIRGKIDELNGKMLHDPNDDTLKELVKYYDQSKYSEPYPEGDIQTQALLDEKEGQKLVIEHYPRTGKYAIRYGKDQWLKGRWPTGIIIPTTTFAVAAFYNTEQEARDAIVLFKEQQFKSGVIEIKV